MAQVYLSQTEIDEINRRLAKLEEQVEQLRYLVVEQQEQIETLQDGWSA